MHEKIVDILNSHGRELPFEYTENSSIADVIKKLYLDDLTIKKFNKTTDTLDTNLLEKFFNKYLILNRGSNACSKKSSPDTFESLFGENVEEETKMGLLYDLISNIFKGYTGEGVYKSDDQVYTPNPTLLVDFIDAEIQENNNKRNLDKESFQTSYGKKINDLRNDLREYKYGNKWRKICYFFNKILPEIFENKDIKDCANKEKIPDSNSDKINPN